MAARGFGSATIGSASAGNIASPTVASRVNNWLIQGSATGNPIQAVVDPASGDTNVSAVVGGPKGTGAIQAQVNDAAITGGNVRGANAVDWSTVRLAATAVASGATSTVSGGSNNTASASGAAVGGGTSNAASGGTSTIAGGTTNTASGTNSAVAGGAGNTTAGTNSWSPGGREASDRGTTGRGAWASARFATNGDAQSGEFVLRRITTDATGSAVTSDAGAASTTNQVTLPNNGTYMARGIVNAHQTGGAAGTANDSAGWEFTALIKRGANAAATVLIGSSAGVATAPLYSDAAAAAWRIVLSADTTNGALSIGITGEVNKTIRWVARVMTAECTS